MGNGDMLPRDGLNKVIQQAFLAAGARCGGGPQVARAIRQAAELR